MPLCWLQPDTQKIARWMRTYLRVVAVQGTMQVAIIVVMARFATGFLGHYATTKFMTTSCGCSAKWGAQQDALATVRHFNARLSAKKSAWF